MQHLHHKCYHHSYHHQQHSCRDHSWGLYTGEKAGGLTVFIMKWRPQIRLYIQSSAISGAQARQLARLHIHTSSCTHSLTTTLAANTTGPVGSPSLPILCRPLDDSRTQYLRAEWYSAASQSPRCSLDQWRQQAAPEHWHSPPDETQVLQTTACLRYASCALSTNTGRQLTSIQLVTMTNK